MASLLKHLNIVATTKHTATVIFLHGLGDSGHGWRPVAGILKASLLHVKWIFPHAPARPVSLNYGMEMPAWFDIRQLSLTAADDEEGILQSIEQVKELIQDEINNGISASRIVLGGFSQGGAISLLTGLTSKYQLAGIVCLSGWLPMQHKLKLMASEHATAIPIFWGHGTADPVVAYDQLAKPSIDYLKKEVAIRDATEQDLVGLYLRLYEDELHTTCPEEIRDMQKWLARILPLE